MKAKNFKTIWNYADQRWETNEILIVIENGIRFKDDDWYCDLVMTPYDKDGNKLAFANEDEGNEWVKKIECNYRINGNRDGGYEIHEC